jgi:hypothetical protein
VKDAQIRKRLPRKKILGAAAQRGDASAGGSEFEKRIMLKDCRDANMVSWMPDSNKETR